MSNSMTIRELDLGEINYVSGGKTVTSVEGCKAAYPKAGGPEGYSNQDNAKIRVCEGEVRATGSHEAPDVPARGVMDLIRDTVSDWLNDFFSIDDYTFDCDD